MVPDTAVQVTEVFVLVPLTVAANCCDPPVLTVVFCGLTATLSFEVTVTFAVLLFLGSALLVAVTLSVPPAGTFAGAM